MEKVKPLPCPLCSMEMKEHPTCFAHPNGDCVLSRYSFDNAKIIKWNVRP
jgi:hypothetical protein